MKYLPLFFLIPFITFAQVSEVMIGDVSVSYDERVEVTTGVLYYSEGELVASEYDNDKDGQTDTWLQYSGEVVVLEVTDTDGDGEADVTTVLDLDGEVLSIEGDGTAQYEQVDAVDFREIVSEQGGSEAAALDDLVGSLDRITIPGGGIPFVTIILWILILGGGYWFYKNRTKLQKNDT